MKRKVVKVENYVGRNARGTKGSNYLTLECGHVRRQKGSIRVPGFCICRDCAALLAVNPLWEHDAEGL